MFHFGKSATVFVFILFSPSSFVCVRRNQLSKLAFKTTRVKDTQLTLATIPFQVGVNNSLLFLTLQTYEKKFAEFPFLQDL